MIALLIGRLAQIILTFVSVKIATTLLSPSTYGQVSLFLALIAGFNLILINPVGMFINRKLHGWVREKKVTYYFSLYGVYLLLACLFAVIFCTIFSYSGISLIKGISLPWILIVMCVSIFFNTANQTFIPSLNLLGFRNWFVILTTITLLCSLILSLGLVYFIKPIAEYWQFGQVVGQAMIGVLAGIMFFKMINCGTLAKRKSQQLNRDMLKSVLLFSAPVAISVGLMWVQTQSYRFLIGKEMGLYTLGLFFAGYSISRTVIASFETIVTSYFLPQFYQEVSTSSQHGDIWQKYAQAIFPALLLTMVFIIMFAPEITRILLSSKFYYAYHYVLWGALAEGGRVVVSTYSYLAHAKMDTKRLIIPNFVGAAVALVFVFLLIPIYKANGVGFALALASIAAVIAIHFTLTKKSTANLSFKCLFKSILFSMGLCGLMLVARLVFPRAIDMKEALIWVGCFGIIYLLLVSSLLYGSLKSW